MDEFLCLPNAADIKSIVKLQKSQLKFDGMFGLLDYTHPYWNIDQRLGMEHLKEKNNPSNVLKAICDYHTYFWHASDGYAKTLNNHNY